MNYSNLQMLYAGLHLINIFCITGKHGGRGYAYWPAGDLTTNGLSWHSYFQFHA